MFPSGILKGPVLPQRQLSLNKELSLQGVCPSRSGTWQGKLGLFPCCEHSHIHTEKIYSPRLKLLEVGTSMETWHEKNLLKNVSELQTGSWANGTTW